MWPAQAGAGRPVGRAAAPSPHLAPRHFTPQGDLAGRGGGGDDDDEDAFSLSGWSDDDDEVSSPLDSVDPWVFFADVMGALGQQDAARAAALQGGLDFKGQALAMGLTQFAQQRREEIAKEAAEAAAGGGGAAAGSG